MAKTTGNDVKTKSRASMIIDGDIEPETAKERGLLNLRKRVPFNQMDAEKRKEICRKGAKAINQLHGEKKTARECLTNILSLKITDEIVAGADIDPAIAERLKRDNPNATIYDLIHAVAVGRALEGSVNAMQFIRDTNGDKPTDRIDVTGEIVTDSDRALMQAIAQRLDSGERLEVVKDLQPEQ